MSQITNNITHDLTPVSYHLFPPLQHAQMQAGDYNEISKAFERLDLDQEAIANDRRQKALAAARRKLFKYVSSVLSFDYTFDNSSLGLSMTF